VNEEYGHQPIYKSVVEIIKRCPDSKECGYPYAHAIPAGDQFMYRGTDILCPTSSRRSFWWKGILSPPIPKPVEEGEF
jgi:hypothetical protein